MAYPINDNPWLHAPKILDARYGPYESTVQALFYLEPYIRCQGLTVGVYVYDAELEAYYIQEYWFEYGTEDIHLVPKPRKLHQMDDPLYHDSPEEENYNKPVRANPVDGAIEYRDPYVTFYCDVLPDVFQPGLTVGDVGIIKDTMKEFRLLEFGAIGSEYRYWIETTSPKFELPEPTPTPTL